MGTSRQACSFTLRRFFGLLFTWSSVTALGIFNQWEEEIWRLRTWGANGHRVVQTLPHRLLLFLTFMSQLLKSRFTTVLDGICSLGWLLGSCRFFVFFFFFLPYWKLVLRTKAEGTSDALPVKPASNFLPHTYTEMPSMLTLLRLNIPRHFPCARQF